MLQTAQAAREKSKDPVPSNHLWSPSVRTQLPYLSGRGSHHLGDLRKLWQAGCRRSTFVLTHTPPPPRNFLHHIREDRAPERMDGGWGGRCPGPWEPRAQQQPASQSWCVPRPWLCSFRDGMHFRLGPGLSLQVDNCHQGRPQVPRPFFLPTKRGTQQTTLLP